MLVQAVARLVLFGPVRAEPYMASEQFLSAEFQAFVRLNVINGGAYLLERASVLASLRDAVVGGRVGQVVKVAVIEPFLAGQGIDLALADLGHRRL